ncbi:hypothetical protein [Mycoplasma capricolum]|uniref:hypothetical protein n=1 Tax=Mycoplasma capricolum TaxID=2095 RepID=UPI003DA23F4C
MNIYQEFVNQYDYDIRKTKSARWIDQKCTFDVLTLVADCIVEYCKNNNQFTIHDIWYSDYAVNNVIEIFSKPDPKIKSKNEYDKYFSQPIKLLEYSKILASKKINNKNYYYINNLEILKNIAFRDTQAIEFLYVYIVKVLKDSDLWKEFENFYKLQNNDSFINLKTKFIDFTIANTAINNKRECSRIFTKIINPISYKLKKLGTKRGFLSNNAITLSDLRYNNFNFRDLKTQKSKSLSREEHEFQLRQRINAYTKYSVQKAKKLVKEYNEKFHNSLSEINTDNIKATQAHHIFSESEFQEIANYLENLIVLTPDQHFLMAHPENHTHYVDKDFQYICLLAKINTLINDLVSNNKDKIYNFENFKQVLNIGLNTNEFENIDDLDFLTVIQKIDDIYGEPKQNQYDNLKQLIIRNILDKLSNK